MLLRLCGIFNLFCFILICCQSSSIGSGHNLRDKADECSANCEILSDHVFKEYAAGLQSREDIIKKDRVSAKHEHEVMFAVKHKNLGILERILHDTSDPKSDRYGHHLTRAEVEDLTSNKESQVAILTFLEGHGVTVVSESLYGEFITAQAPIGLWETLFNTEFYTFHHQRSEDEVVNKLVRAEKYSIPRGLHHHVDAVFGTIQMPSMMWGRPIMTRVNNSSIKPQSVTGYTTPSLLNSFYNIDSNTGSAASTQAAFETIGQYINEDDLLKFQKYFNLPNQSLTSKVGGHVDSANTVCNSNPDICTEPNLDIQYLMAVSQVSPTTHWYTDLNNFSSWLSSIANTANPPLVLSISYGANEDTVSKSEFDAFNVQAIKLNSMGITIVASSGGKNM